MVWTSMPPAKYIHPPTTAVLELRLTLPELWKLCRVAPRRGILACSFRGDFKGHKNVCTVVLPAGTRLNVEKLRTHEQAHCNGWPSNHRGGHLEYVGEYR
jgi:hypothetical protein